MGGRRVSGLERCWRGCVIDCSGGKRMDMWECGSAALSRGWIGFGLLRRISRFSMSTFDISVLMADVASKRSRYHLIDWSMCERPSLLTAAIEALYLVDLLTAWPIHCSANNLCGDCSDVSLRSSTQ